MLHRRPLALFCLVPGLLAPAARAADQTVNITGLAFSPRNVTIQVGDTVTWVNNNQGAHNVVANNGSFRSGEPEDQFTFSHTFTTAGSFGYHCQPHQALGMTGTVTVEAGGGGGEQGGVGDRRPDLVEVVADAHDRADDRRDKDREQRPRFARDAFGPRRESDQHRRCERADGELTHRERRLEREARIDPHGHGDGARGHRAR